jgi:hypothetical protein
MRSAAFSADRLNRLCRRSGLLRLRRLDVARLVHDLVVRLAVVAAHGATEVPESLSERAASLGKSLGSEHEQRDNENQEQVRRLKDVVDEWHRHKLTRWAAPAKGLFGVGGSYGSMRPVIKAFLGAITVLLAGAGAAVGPTTTVRFVRVRTSAPVHVRTSAEGTNSTPGALALPQLGFVSFRCRPDWSVQPVFDLRGAAATEAVTVRAGGIVRRNLRGRIAERVRGGSLIEQQFSRAREVALPFGHYGTARFTVRQADEAHEISAAVTADFVAGTFAKRGVSRRLGACYVRRWSVQMDVRPY